MDRRIKAGVTIEISGRCQAKCPYCARARFTPDRFLGENMPVETFESIMDHLIEIDIVDRSLVASVALYNWGDPFNHPELDEMIAVLKTKGFQASLSSNFARAPKIQDAHLSAISHMIISLSGMSESTYGRIHGISLRNVLSNFDEFYNRTRCHSPETVFYVAWHRYRFNESEFWDAYRFFDRPNVVFSPVVAFLNDNVDVMEFMKGETSPDRKKCAERDLFIEHIEKTRLFHQKLSAGYACPAWDSLVISESGQLQLCCGFTNQDTEQLLGSILDMTAEDVWRTRPRRVCKECVSSGWARYVYNVTTGGRRDLAFPKGGGMANIKFFVERTCSRKQLHTILQNSKTGRAVISLAKRVSAKL